jgi:hypothetical protein
LNWISAFISLRSLDACCKGDDGSSSMEATWEGLRVEPP